jgi:hypothetical protein
MREDVGFYKLCALRNPLDEWVLRIISTVKEGKAERVALSVLKYNQPARPHCTKGCSYNS